MTTLKDIREYMIEHLSDYDIPYDGEYYDEDGHCGGSLFADIKEFWEDFKTDDDFKYLVSGEWFGDELDLSGGRTYLLSDDKLIDMIFDYMYKTLNWSENNYQDVVWNSCGLTDELYDRYDSISVKRDEKINSIIEGEVQKSPKTKLNWNKSTKKNVWDSIDFEGDFDYIPYVISYPKIRKEEVESYDSLEFLGKSKIDSNTLIYKIKSLGVKIPKGYEIVKPVEDILYGA